MKSLSVIAALALVAACSSQVLAQDASVSAGVSAEVSASVGVSEPSNPASGASSEISSVLNGGSSAATSEAGKVSCDTLDTHKIVTTPIDPSALAAVTSVQIFALNDCAGMADLAAIDAGAAATIGASPAVTAALQAAGETGADIAGYSVEGTTLVVYVKQKG